MNETYVEVPERIQMFEKIQNLEKEISYLKSEINRCRKFEEQLFQSQRMETLACLTGGIAHDFNNILQIVMGHTQMAKRKTNKSGPDYRVYSQIEETLDRGKKLTQQLLKLGSKKKYNPKAMDLNLSIRDAKKLLCRTIPKTIQIDMALAEDLKMIKIDSVQCEQILMNLCINARDAMNGKGYLTIRTENIILERNHPHTFLNSSSGEYILLSITDTGKGIPSNILNHIFEPFYTTKKNGQGTGLGLSIVHEIVKNHGGFIEYESEEHRGTTFTIYFPAIKNSLTQQIKRPTQIPGSYRGNEVILVVDDESHLLAIEKELFQTNGYTVFTAKDGAEAATICSENPVDLVLLDMDMPVMEGIQCLKALLVINPEIKIIISSAYSSNEHMRETLNSGARAFLFKPYHLETLMSTVRNILDDNMN